MSTRELSFEIWQLRLQKDCERWDKLLAYKSLGEECLRILWEVGTEPSVQAIVEGGVKVALQVESPTH